MGKQCRGALSQWPFCLESHTIAGSATSTKHTHIHKKMTTNWKIMKKLEENAYSKNHGQRLHIKVGNLIAILLMLFPLILCGFMFCY